MSVPNFLNAGARNRAAMLGLCTDLASDILEHDHASKEEKTYLKYIVTYTEKWLKALSNRLEPKDLKRLINLYTDSRPSLLPKVTQKRRIPVSDDVILDTLEDLVAMCCSGCKVAEKDCSKCNLFNINQNLNISVEYSNDGYCPYRYEEK